MYLSHFMKGEIDLITSKYLFFSLKFNFVIITAIVEETLKNYVVFTDWLGMAHVNLDEWNLDSALGKRVWREIVCRISGEKRNPPNLDYIQDWIHDTDEKSLKTVPLSLNVFGCIIKREHSTKILVYRRPFSHRERENLKMNLNEGSNLIDCKVHWNQRWYVQIKGTCKPGEHFYLRSFIPRFDMNWCNSDQKMWLKKYVPHECRGNLLILERYVQEKDQSHRELSFITDRSSSLVWHHLTVESQYTFPP